MQHPVQFTIWWGDCETPALLVEPPQTHVNRAFGHMYLTYSHVRDRTDTNLAYAIGKRHDKP